MVLVTAIYHNNVIKNKQFSAEDIEILSSSSRQLLKHHDIHAVWNVEMSNDFIIEDNQVHLGVWGCDYEYNVGRGESIDNAPVIIPVCLTHNCGTAPHTFYVDHFKKLKYYNPETILGRAGAVFGCGPRQADPTRPDCWPFFTKDAGYAAVHLSRVMAYMDGRENGVYVYFFGHFEFRNLGILIFFSLAMVGRGEILTKSRYSVEEIEIMKNRPQELEFYEMMIIFQEEVRKGEILHHSAILDSRRNKVYSAPEFSPKGKSVIDYSTRYRKSGNSKVENEEMDKKMSPSEKAVYDKDIAAGQHVEFAGKLGAIDGVIPKKIDGNGNNVASKRKMSRQNTNLDEEEDKGLSEATEKKKKKKKKVSDSENVIHRSLRNNKEYSGFC